MTVRALLRVAKVPERTPPYDTLYLKVFYKAKRTGSDTELETGIFPPVAESAPYPVVIFLSGANVGQESYQWLAEALAERGLIFVTFAWIGEDFPGMVSLTPGVNIHMVKPETYGTAPAGPALPAILESLTQLQADGLLAGLLDLERVVLGGHSAGGTVALHNASPAYFPQIAGAFTYAGHTGAAAVLGWPPGTILPICPELPYLLIGGTQDGVIAASSSRYGSETNPDYSPIERTFREAIKGGRGDSYYVLIEGANHFSIAYPVDEATGRPFLDNPTTQSDDQIRTVLGELIYSFIETQIRNKGESLEHFTTHPLVSQMERK